MRVASVFLKALEMRFDHQPAAERVGAAGPRYKQSRGNLLPAERYRISPLLVIRRKIRTSAMPLESSGELRRIEPEFRGPQTSLLAAFSFVASGRRGTLVRRDAWRCGESYGQTSLQCGLGAAGALLTRAP